jgi:hypothetical protein
MKIRKPVRTIFAISLFLLAVSFFHNTAAADTNEEPVNRLTHMSIGGKLEINFTRIPNDLRLTAVVGSPYFISDIFSVKGFISQGLFQGVLDSSSNTNQQTWAGYTAFGGGICMAVGRTLDIIRPYAEIGWMGVIPNSTFTSNTFAWGLYGVIGFDILFNPGDIWGFFIEAGTAGFLSGGVAEKIVGDYTYGSGILLNLGVRFYL